MLRFSFLPSDFHPMVLFLGEAPGMKLFAETLRRFARDPSVVDLHECDTLFTADETRIRLTDASAAEPGMHKVSGTARSLTWAIEPWQADMFAEMVEELAEPDCKSGSVMLEVAHGEVKVKVSLGEYTEDFLTAEELARRRG